MPSEPRSIDELKEVPNMFRRTTAGERFLFHDSFEEDEETARTIMFTTRRNWQLLSASPSVDVTNLVFGWDVQNSAQYFY